MLSKRKKRSRNARKHERNKKLINYYLSDELPTMEEVGERFGISESRVQTILDRAGVDAEAVRKQRTRKRQAEITCQQCGSKFWVRPSYSERKYCNLDCRSRANRKMTYPEIVESLKEIYEEHGKLTKKLINKHCDIAYITVYKRVGSLSHIKENILHISND